MLYSRALPLRGYLRPERWIVRFVELLRVGDKPALKLLAHNPFPDAPPRQIRALVYRYQYTTRRERNQSGSWWKRTRRRVLSSRGGSGRRLTKSAPNASPTDRRPALAARPIERVDPGLFVTSPASSTHSPPRLSMSQCILRRAAASAALRPQLRSRAVRDRRRWLSNDYRSNFPVAATNGTTLLAGVPSSNTGFRADTAGCASMANESKHERGPSAQPRAATNMLSDEEIERLALDMESDRVERKNSLSGSAKDKVAQAICAYANDLPGHRAPGLVVIGMDDLGHPTGLAITDDLLLSLGGIRSDGNILPIPTIVVRKVSLLGVDIAVVLVAPSGDPPVRYEGRVWIRVGPRRAVASRDEERILIERRQAADLPYDRRPARGTSLADLDLAFFQQTYLPSAVSAEVLAENERSTEHQLAALHLLAPTSEPNHAALLLLGKDPRAFIAGAYLQFVRFDGGDFGAPILDQKELVGRVDDVLREADTLARLNVRIATIIEGAPTERRMPDYPVTALEQLLRNAVLHRSYEIQAPVYWYWFSDRVEIHSPGGLYGRVTPQNFGARGSTDYRNAGLAEGLRVLGFVQRFGWGIDTVRRRCQQNGNPPPEFEFQPSAVLATLRSRP